MKLHQLFEIRKKNNQDERNKKWIVSYRIKISSKRWKTFATRIELQVSTVVSFSWPIPWNFATFLMEYFCDWISAGGKIWWTYFMLACCWMSDKIVWICSNFCVFWWSNVRIFFNGYIYFYASKLIFVFHLQNLQLFHLKLIDFHRIASVPRFKVTVRSIWFNTI